MSKNHHYYVFHVDKKYVRVVDAANSFQARTVLASACRAPVTDFYAVREDLLTASDRKIIDKARVG